MLHAALGLALGLLAPLQGDPAKDIKSKDYETRLAAIVELSLGHEKAEKLLVGALKDKDWEVVEKAAAALGKVGGKTSAAALLKVVLGGPTQRIRRVAAEALAEAHAEAGFELLAKKMSGKTAKEAAVAASAFWPLLDGKVELKALEKLWKSKEKGMRAAAAPGLILLSGARRPEMLTMILSGPSELPRVEASALALEAVAMSGDMSCLEGVLSVFDGRESDVLKRRARAAALALLMADENGDELFDSLWERGLQADPLGAAPHYVRLFTEAVVQGVFDLGETRKQFLQCLTQSDERKHRDLRAAIVDALAKLRIQSKSTESTGGALDFLGGSGGEKAATADKSAGDDQSKEKRIPPHPESVQALVETMRTDPEDRVRSAAIRSLVEMMPASHPTRVEALIGVLKKDASGPVREDAAVALGTKGAPSAVAALAEALQDQNPWVAVVAAVSLGMTQDAKAVQPLTDLLQHEDWRLRGAALSGLARSYLKEAVPPLISGLNDVDATVRRAAHQHLTALANQQIEPTVEAWTAWWDQVKRSYQLFDPAEAERRNKLYGYASLNEHGTATLFKNQDVIVYQSRGDHMEHVLDALTIQHGKTAYGKLHEAELHPRAVFVVNCTGEIDAKDVDRIGWFVRTGGYLLGSCWALSETINRVYPGVVDRHPAPGEVMDTVMASPCNQHSPFLREVFPDGVQPIYSLVGAHLIRVLDPERCEVLVDSAQCAERWGEGNLAVWFPAGHGIIMDSVNHFEEQGLGNAPWLKKPEQRQAFAIDHMGLSYEQWRDSRKEKYWSKGGQAAREVLDLSVFRLISNFVRKKRISDE
jgi:HEAT repeat protein